MLERIIVTAGGTGGHIYPAVAIAEELMERGIDILFVGNKNSVEERIAQERNLPFSAIDVQKLYRNLTFKHLKFPFKLMKSLLLSSRIIRQFKPDACIGTGGFVCGPILFLAYWKGIPVYLQEQNSYPGLTTKLLSRRTRKIFIGYKSAGKYLPPEKTLYTGNPLQKVYTSESKPVEQSLRKRVTLLVLGGSQGARTINNSVLSIMKELSNMNLNILWQTGKNDFLRIKNSLGNLFINNDLDKKDKPSSETDSTLKELSEELYEVNTTLRVFPFSSSMHKIYTVTDLAITRAGALTLAELESMKIPSVIIPIPKSAGNHQLLNARHQQEEMKGVVLEQRDLTPNLLLTTISSMIANLQDYRTQTTSSKHLTATQEIVNTVLSDFAEKQEEL